MTADEARAIHEDMRLLLKKVVDGSRLGASREYMEKWLNELDVLMRYSLSEAVRAGPAPEGILESLTAH